MTSIKPARAICSCNVEKKKICVGLGWPTLVWLGPHRLIQGASHGMEEENQSLLLTSFPTSCVCWLVHICSWHTGALLSCALPPSHLSQNPARLKPQRGTKPVGWKTCSSCLQQQPSARLMEKLCFRKAEESLRAARMCCVPPGPGVNPGGPRFFLQLTCSGVSQWLQVLALADYCSFCFLHVSFGFGFILISCPCFSS